MNTIKEKNYLLAISHCIMEAFPIKEGHPLNTHIMELQRETDYENFMKRLDKAKKLTLGDNSPAHSENRFVSSIFQRVGQGETEATSPADADYNVPMHKLSLSPDNFPCAGNKEQNPLADEFWEDAKSLPVNSPEILAENLLNLLFIYGQSVNCGYKGAEDITLYDYTRTVAALSVCIADAEDESSADPVLLVGADFSGIQPYIYQIISKYAAKNLKGRSFYLTILSDAVVRYLLKELSLFSANVLYNSGGGFYLLVPNTAETLSKLKTCIDQIEQQMFDTHHTTLYVAIDYVTLGAEQLLRTNGKSLREPWKELFLKRDRRKNSKFSNIISENYETLFSPENQKAAYLFDTITGERIKEDEKVREEGEIKNLKETTYRQIKLGTALKECHMMVVSETPLCELEKSIKAFVQPAGLGFYYYLLDTRSYYTAIKSIEKEGKNVWVITMNGRNNCCEYLPEDPRSFIYSLQFYGGNAFHHQTFEELCGEGEFKRLGVLRMDVDNLGSIFQSGISEQSATLARYASLSHAMDFYFSGYINHLQEKIGPGQSQIIYSGGDDLFIVGQWNTTIEIAEAIREDFRKYTCNNPKFSISGGIAIIGEKFPIMKGADESADEEENAKKHCCGSSEKDSISFMSMALHWKHEYPYVKELKERIFELIDKDELPKSFVSKVLNHLENANLKDHKIRNIKTYWMITYDLSRMVQRGTNSKVQDLIERCKKDICENKPRLLHTTPIRTDYHPLELWGMAARWAELEYRTNKL